MNTSFDTDGGNESDDDVEDELKCSQKGYCHFNEDGSKKNFSISLFGHDLDIEQDPSSRLLGHGAVVWDAAVIFSKYMEHDPKQFSAEKFHGRSVIELGSGCGLGGIGFMMKGARVMLTDMQKVTETLTETNANRIYSRLKSKGSGALPYPILTPTVRSLDWTDFESFNSVGFTDDGLYDIVLLTDCVFAAALAVPLVNCIRRLTGTRSTVYCCHEIRDEVSKLLHLCPNRAQQHSFTSLPEVQNKLTGTFNYYLPCRDRIASCHTNLISVILFLFYMSQSYFSSLVMFIDYFLNLKQN